MADSYPHIPMPLDEAERQLAVDRSGVLTQARRPELQQIVDRAADLFGTPIAAISIIDHGRQWFAARKGLDVAETPREQSFCAHAIHRPGEPLVVNDASQDKRFASNPLVLGAPRMRFYAGMPLIDRQGYPLGALCIIDSSPREQTPDLLELADLAREAERLIVR